MLEKIGTSKTPKGAYNQVVAMTKDQAMLPRNTQVSEYVQRTIRQGDPNYIPSGKGNIAIGAESIHNTVVLNQSYMKRYAIDSEIGLPEVYIW